MRSVVTGAWRRLIQAADWVWTYCVRELDPKYVVTAFLLSNAFIAAIACYLTKTWADFYTVSGYWITLTGLLVAIFELYRARTVAKEVQDKLSEQVRRHRAEHYRFCLEQAKSSLGDAQTYVQSRRWTSVEVRLNDLIGHLSYVNAISPAADDRWTMFANSTREWTVVFGGGRNGQRLQFDADAWAQLTLAVREQLDNELAPFKFGGDVNDDVE